MIQKEETVYKGSLRLETEFQLQPKSNAKRP
jgi:hypothetical protein